MLGRTLAAPSGASLTGFTDQRWNGVTTLQCARVCAAVIAGARVDSLQHVVPADSVNRADLPALIAVAFGRTDLRVAREPGPVDRRLATLRPAVNRGLWQAAGYPEPPSIEAMVAELAAFERRP